MNTSCGEVKTIFPAFEEVFNMKVVGGVGTLKHMIYSSEQLFANKGVSKTTMFVFLYRKTFFFSNGPEQLHVHGAKATYDSHKHWIEGDGLTQAIIVTGRPKPFLKEAANHQRKSAMQLLKLMHQENVLNNYLYFHFCQPSPCVNTVVREGFVDYPNKLEAKAEKVALLVVFETIEKDWWKRVIPRNGIKKSFDCVLEIFYKISIFKYKLSYAFT